MLEPIRELVAPLLLMQWLQIDTPAETFNPMVYASDKKQFGNLRKRNAFIRGEHPQEFDWKLSDYERNSVPLLRVLVFRFAPGIHARIPVFRGNQSAELNVASDAEIGIILAGMVRQHGLNLDECLTYDAKLKVSH